MLKKKQTLRSVKMLKIKLIQIKLFFFRISLLSLLHSLYYPDG